MNKQANVYVAGVLLSGLSLMGLSLWNFTAPTLSLLTTFVVLTCLGTVAQLYEAQAPGRNSYYTDIVFFFAGVLLLPPFLFALSAAIPHLIESVRDHWVKSERRRAWYIQPFNIATHIIAGFGAQWVRLLIDKHSELYVYAEGLLSVGAAVLLYVLINHSLVALALKLARGVSIKESGIMGWENLSTDWVLASIGYVLAMLWTLNPWLIAPALAPLLMIYRALTVPQLKQEAQVDAKTGLFNARHFNKALASELERAKRSANPLALIMADLDFLRNINNTYGHLAGDVVLADIGQTIQKSIRSSDIAARFGGEEFAVILPEADTETARALAERLRKAVAAQEFTVPTSSTPIKVTMSIGMSCYPLDAQEPKDLIHQADIAVYQAKLKGRNRVVCVSEVPHSVRLESSFISERGHTTETPTPSVSSETPKPAAEAKTPSVEAQPVPAAHTTLPKPVEPVRKAHAAFVWRLFPFFVAALIGSASLLVLSSVLYTVSVSIWLVGLLVLLAIVAEVMQLNLFDENTLSVSVAINFAAGLIAGVPGIALVSAAIALVHKARVQPPLHRTYINWATHVLAGAVPLAFAQFVPAWYQLDAWLLIALTTLLALLYFCLDTGLLAVAMSLASGSNPLAKWREQFQWLVVHYLVLCVLGMFLGLSYQETPSSKWLIFALPVFLVRFAQKQYIERTKNSVQELRRMNWELSVANRTIQEANRSIKALNEELFVTLANIIDARDPFVSSHAAQVAEYATAIAKDMQLPAERVERIRQAGFLHDIGKIAIAEHVLHKPAKLTPEEYELVKTHSMVGAEFIASSQMLRHLAPFVRHHHERWDGGGYPDRLQREQIPLEARILAVCDAVEAMASDRPYHRGMSLPDIIAELQRCNGTQFDPLAVESFIRVVNQYGEQIIVNSAQQISQKRILNPQDKKDDPPDQGLTVALKPPSSLAQSPVPV